MRIPKIISSVDVPLRDSLVTRLWAPVQALPILAISCQPASIEILLGSSYDLYYLRVEIGYDGIPIQEQILCHAHDNSDHHRGSVVSHDLSRIAKRTLSDIQIWSKATGWRNIPITPDTYHNEDTSRDVALHPTDPNILAYFDRTTNSIHIVDTTKQSISPILTIHIESTECCFLTWSDDGSNLACGSRNSQTLIWYVDLATKIATRKALFSHTANIVCFRPPSASQFLLVSHYSIELYSVESGERVRKYYYPPMLSGNRYTFMATFSPDGDLFATFHPGGLEITIYETDTGRRYHTNIPLTQPVRKVQFTPNGEQLVAICGNYHLPDNLENYWTSILGEEIYVVDVRRNCRVSDDVRFDWDNKRGHYGRISSANFSPDETKFLTSSDDGAIHVRSTTDCMLLREYWPLEHDLPVSIAVWSIDGTSIYYSLGDGAVLYSSSGDILYDAIPLDGCSQIHAIKPYSAGTEEHIALFVSEWTPPSYQNYKIIVISTESVPAVLRNTYYIKTWKTNPISVSSDGLAAYYQYSRPGRSVLLDLERGTTTELFTQESSGHESGYRDNKTPVIFPRGSRFMLVEEVQMKETIAEDGSTGGSDEETAHSDMAWPENEEDDSSIDVPDSEYETSDATMSDSEDEGGDFDPTIFKCTIWDIATKDIIQTFDLSRPSPSLRYTLLDIAVSDDHGSIAFLGYYLRKSGIGRPPVMQVWTWTGEDYTREIVHSTEHISTYGHCTDITRDGKRLLMVSDQALVMYDLDSIPTAEENRPESILSATNHTGDPTHVSTVPPDWIYAYAKGMRERGQILDQDNHKLLLLANEMMERLDPPGSSHVIRRDRLKIDAPKLLEMQDWVDFFKPTSSSRRA